MNLKEQITQARDAHVTAVEVPEWNATVYLKQLSVRDRLSLMERVNESNTGKLSVFALLFTLCDESGTLVFGADDYDLLASKNARVIDRLGKQSTELNSMMGEAVESEKKS